MLKRVSEQAAAMVGRPMRVRLGVSAGEETGIGLLELGAFADGTKITLRPRTSFGTKQQQDKRIIDYLNYAEQALQSG